jgi:ABC-type multidrug transport system fused ATPase/permease subunit
MNRQEVTSLYQDRLSQQQAIIRQSLHKWRAVSYLRGISFLASVAVLIMGLAQVAGLWTVWLILAGLLFLGFLVIAFVHEGMQSQLKIGSLLANMHRESLARLERRWKEIEVPQVEVPSALTAVSADLDLFTDSSIYKLLGTARTPNGMETLRNWIAEPASAEEIKERQSAVAELAPEFDWRLQFSLRCEQLKIARSGPSGFVAWSESGNWFAGRQWLRRLARMTSLISILGITGLLLGFVPPLTAVAILAGGMLINFVLSVVFAGGLHDIFNQISSQANEATHFVKLFDSIAVFPAKSLKLKSLQIDLNNPEHAASRNMHSLARLIGLANMRRNGILFIPYLIFEFLFFWDVHCLDLLEKWKAAHGSKVRGWFADLGQWEALLALAKLAFDEPEWNFPTVNDKGEPREVVFVAKALGHPLLKNDRVYNDASVGPPGTVLLVTGSNMSGKSTLLRSIGLNVVLAQMGSVVCAQSLRLSSVRVETSMRIADSLSDGVSFFMAELKRLKEIVDVAEAIRRDPKRSMLFLLDEILQGTNSRERQIAVSRVVRKLIDENAIGAISTHDLDLATTEELKSACQTVHFSEHFVDVNGKREMRFDYRMKPGIAETTNALKLLELVGLGE